MSDNELQLQINYRLLEQLSASEKRFEYIVEHLRAIIFQLDADGELSFANAAWQELTGEAVAQSIGRRLSSWFEPSDVVTTLSKFEQGECDAVAGEVSLVDHNGQRFWLQLDLRRDLGSGAGNGSLVDVSTRHEVERKLRISALEARKLSLVAKQTDNLVIITGRDGLIEWVNTGFERVSGYCADEAIGKTPGALLQGSLTDPRAIQTMRDAIAAGKGFHVEIANYSRDGKVYWVDIEATAVHDDNGELTNFIAIERDITAAREQAKVLTAAKEAAEALAADRDLLVANVSHELRTPLNAILGMTELLALQPLTDQSQQLVDGIQHAGDRLLALVNDVLDYSRLNAQAVELEKTPLYLQAVLDESLCLVQQEAEQKGLSIYASVKGAAEDCRVPVLGDPLRLAQVITNLLSNAVKFTDAGRVDIKLDQISLDQTSELVSLTVLDTGVGLPKGGLDSILAPFTQADSSTTRRFGGSGLGLTITSKLITAMGGNLRAWNQPDGGAGFEVRLVFPRCPKDKLEPTSLVVSSQLGPAPQTLAALEQPVTDGSSAVSTKAMSDTRLRVLVVEDNATNQLVVSQQLESLGHQVDVANNGMEGFLRVQQHHYDVCLMDAQMPVLDGIEACRLIRVAESLAANPQRLPIVALTAGALKGDRRRCLMAGMNGYLSKPARLSELNAVLHEVTSQSFEDSARDMTRDIGSQDLLALLHRLSSSGLVPASRLHRDLEMASAVEDMARSIYRLNRENLDHPLEQGVEVPFSDSLPPSWVSYCRQRMARL